MLSLFITSDYLFLPLPSLYACQNVEAMARKRFERQAATMVKPRNPIVNEFQPFERSNKALLMPSYTSVHARGKTAPALGTRNNVSMGSDPARAKLSSKYDSCLRSIGQVQALNQKKRDVQVEMEHIRRVLEHKQICLAAGAYGGYRKLIENLHPALRQVTAADDIV